MITLTGERWAPGVYNVLETAINESRRAGRIGYACYQAFWLGALDRDALNAVTLAKYSNQKTKYYFDAYNLGGLRGWEERVIDRYFADCRTILVPAAGAGREIAALAARGFEVSAFECTAALVDVATRFLAKQGVATWVHLTAPDEVPQLGVHDGIVIGWGAYMHIAGASRRIAFLRGLRGQIRSGGPMLASFYTRKGDSRELRFIAKAANALRRLRGSKELIEVGDELRGSFRHNLTESEVRREFEQGGFRLEEFSELEHPYAVGFAA
ncbi:MAG: hypothetical protein JO101_06800 [Candidatus Eremiobacteraeota bacterium]|nr:hypothetical protein [Candidatus Eremiobacteraeota bacterium]MBV8355011.1 hypothetical protein [Candidatus Eremiobacteraeota bacterium]